MKKHVWEIQLSIMNTYAQMSATGEGDPDKYIQIMNQFMTQCGLPTVPILPSSPPSS